MKCQKCTKQATLHITEIVSEEQFEELHLCEECANKHLYEPQGKGLGKGSDTGPAEESEEMAALNQRQCPMCGIKFVEFGWYQESELAEMPMPFIFVAWPLTGVTWLIFLGEIFYDNIRVLAGKSAR